jgi:rSAM/selenodomain-associated transferase 1
VKRALVVVAKEPVPGQTKTRLSPPLDPEQAVELYRAFLLDTLDLVAQVEGASAIVAYTPETARGYFSQIAPRGFGLVPQMGENLGQRLDHVSTHCLCTGYDQVVVMNSDGPTLPVEHLRQAFDLLDRSDVDVVLGPSDDGGYYLVGLKRSCPALFDVVMSTPTVLQETLALACEQGLRSACLPSWYDVDTPADLQRLGKELLSRPDHVAARTRQLLAQWAQAGTVAAASGKRPSRSPKEGG